MRTGLNDNVLAILFPALIGLVFLLIGYLMLKRRNMLKKECTAQANVTDINIRSSRKNNKYLEFKYTVEGVEYAKNIQINNELYNSINNSNSVTVLYDPSDPRQFYIPENSMAAFSVAIPFAVGVMMILLNVFLFFTVM